MNSLVVWRTQRYTIQFQLNYALLYCQDLYSNINNKLRMFIIANKKEEKQMFIDSKMDKYIYFMVTSWEKKDVNFEGQSRNF